MKITKKTGSKERQIILGIITHDAVCGRLGSKWDKKEGLFESPWANLVAGWCFKFHRKYNKAPRKSVEGLFQSWATEEGKDKETVRLIEKFLTGLSGEYARLKKGINPDYLVDIAGEHFNEVRINNLTDELKGDVDSGKLASAYKRLAKFRKIELGKGSVIDVLNDKNIWKKVHEQRPETLIKFPKGSGLERFYGRDLGRDKFVAFMGPMKRGKSFWMKDLAWRGALQRRRVLMFQLGDLTDVQMLLRLGARIACRPMDAGEVKYPTNIEWEDEDQTSVTVKHRIKKYKRAMTYEDNVRACKAIRDDRLKSDEPFLKMSCHSTKSLSMDGLRSIVDEQVRQNWIPDIIVIDYADILARPPGFQGESRDAVNENWMDMRRLSTDLHCLVVTGTQANAASFKTHMLDMTHFSEDNRKYAQVSAMIGLNQDPEEKELQVTRLNWLVNRDSPWSPLQYCYCAGALDLCNPSIRSIMR